MNKINVVIVDDHKLLREGLESMLNKVEHIEIVGSVSSGEEAVNIASEKEPDVILMDIVMYGMSGIEATRWIKEQNPDIKIIIVSMEVNEKFIDEGIKSGINGYLPKDVDKQTLIEAINQVHNGEKYFSSKVTKMVIEALYATEKSDKPSNSELTKRELEVLKEVANGKSNKEVGEALFISVKTVETHKSHILEKLGLKNTTELVKYAIKNEIIDL